MNTWVGPPEPPRQLPGPMGWLRAVMRGVPLAVLVFGGLLILLLVRMIERPMHGLHRPWTPYITQFVCRNAFRIMGMGWKTRGAPMPARGAVVANHSAWLDIFSLNAAKRIYFVSKAEVSGWPGIGWLAKATGTVFIERDRRHARAQTELFQKRLLAGHKLLFFPEGTSTDGVQVLPFKTTLFASFFTPELRDEIKIQPVSVFYAPPKGQDERFYGWWGEMDFGSHLLKVLAAPRQGHVEIMYHLPVNVCDFPDRKSLAKFCEETVRTGHDLLAQEARDPASVDLPRSTQQ